MKKTFIFVLVVFACLTQASMILADNAAHSSAAPDISGGNSTFPVEELFEEARKPDDKFFMEFVNMLFTLGLIIGLILIVAWFLKRMVNNKLEQANLTSAIKVLERRTLSPKTSVYLIEIHDKTIALAESADGVALLTEFPFTMSGSEEETSDIPSSFKNILDR